MEDFFVQDALMSMTSHLVFIVITWYALQAVNLDGLFRKGKVFEARILVIFLTIAIGTTVSRFFLDFLSWSNSLIYLF
ncbi:DUF1146 family protein [Salimicrobium flavidum]|uniref:Conserved hypothetical integral membrane protein n=1 Tax=Salimicrobium flavidum TaxID=570947 RepID=A0A1N7IWA3_9BACI|nr:DUF1146 family protein [Salimicrobium flavidum]SIS41276.1 conserved hypothetical integral membrane protein [Salimicrobium flavidum]